MSPGPATSCIVGLAYPIAEARSKPCGTINAGRMSLDRRVRRVSPWRREEFRKRPQGHLLRSGSPAPDQTAAPGVGASMRSGGTARPCLDRFRPTRESDLTWSLRLSKNSIASLEATPRPSRHLGDGVGELAMADRPKELRHGPLLFGNEPRLLHRTAGLSTRRPCATLHRIAPITAERAALCVSRSRQQHRGRACRSCPLRLPDHHQQCWRRRRDSANLGCPPAVLPSLARARAACRT